MKKLYRIDFKEARYWVVAGDPLTALEMYRDYYQKDVSKYECYLDILSIKVVSKEVITR